MQRNPNTFSDRRAPANYISGLGRGANSFSTSAAHGIVSVPTFGSAPSGYVPGMGRGSGGFGDKKPEGTMLPGDTAAGGGGGRFDPMLGYEATGSFFNQAAEYGTEDQYADAVYNQVDEMRSMVKRRKPATAAAAAPSKSGITSFKSIADDFADLKPGLKQVSVDDWLNMPETATSSRNKKKREEHVRFAPVTDSLLASMVDRHTNSTSNNNNSSEDLSRLSQARDQMLRVNLDRAAGDSALKGTQTSVDPRGFLTQLSGQLDASSQLGDAKKARLLLKSVTNTNPTHGPGWIAAARVEEIAGQPAKAREIMQRACEACPDQEDVWLEASRLEPGKAEAKAVLLKAVSRHLPQSVTLWLAAADLEITMEDAHDLVRLEEIGSFKRRKAAVVPPPSSMEEAKDERQAQLGRRKELVRQALGRVPDSIKLWQNLITMERKDAEARELVARALAACPDAIDFHIASARLETTLPAAQKRLNEARKRFPGEVRIWIAACRLVEEQEEVSVQARQTQLEQIILQAFKRTTHANRQIWLKQAEICERDAYPLACCALLKQCLGMGVEDADRLLTWRADAAAFESQKLPLCAKVCLELVVEVFGATSREVWQDLIRFAEVPEHGVNKMEVLERAVRAMPTCELFWLMLAKETWKADAAMGGGVEAARAVLNRAFEQCGGGEELWFAAAKLANEISPAHAREIFKQAREREDSERVWIKSVVHERRIPNNAEAEESLCRAALQRFPKNEKLHLMLGQVLEWRREMELARQVYANAVTVCAKSVALWQSLARVEEALGSFVRARAVLDNARSKIANSPALWLAAIRLERRAASPESTVQNYLARALQAFPSDGPLLAEQVEIAPEQKKESLAELAFKKTQGKDVHVILCCAKLWWRKRPLDANKVKKWLERAIALQPKFGDAWAAYYRFVTSSSSNSSKEASEIMRRCVEAEPSRGERWIKVSKGRGNEALNTEQILHLVANEFSMAGEEEEV